MKKHGRGRGLHSSFFFLCHFITGPHITSIMFRAGHRGCLEAHYFIWLAGLMFFAALFSRQFPFIDSVAQLSRFRLIRFEEALLARATTLYCIISRQQVRGRAMPRDSPFSALGLSLCCTAPYCSRRLPFSLLADCSLATDFHFSLISSVSYFHASLRYSRCALW